MVPNDETLFDKVVNLSKRRGFVFQSAEIYGGFRSTYDYGPIGVLLLRNVKEQWGSPNKHRLQGVPGGGVPGHGGEVERVKLGVELGTHLWVRRTLRCVIREVRLTGVGSRLGHVARC